MIAKLTKIPEPTKFDSGKQISLKSTHVDEPASSEVKHIDLSSNSFTLADAQNRLECIIADPTLGFANTRTANAGRFHISNGRALDRHGNLLTRENEEEAMVYVFDTDDCGGYAIMGAKPELPELISICQGDSSESATYDTSDSMKSFISSLRDSLIVDPVVPIIPIETEWVRGKTRYSRLNLCTAISNEWGIDLPYSMAWLVLSTSTPNPMPRHSSVAATSLLLLSDRYDYMTDSLRDV